MHFHKYYYAESAISGSRRVVRSVFSHTMVKKSQSFQPYRAQTGLISQDTSKLHLKHLHGYLQYSCKPFCANMQADLHLCCPHIIEFSFLRGRLADRRTVRALQKKSTATYLSTSSKSIRKCRLCRWLRHLSRHCLPKIYLLVSRMKRINIFLTTQHCGTQVGMCFSFGKAFENRKSAIPGAIK